MIATYNGYEYIDYKNALEMEDGDNKFIKASIECMVGNDKKVYQIIYHGLKKAN
jgi:hypothetical protein